MNNKSSKLLLTLGIVLLAFVLVYGWPTRYRYEHISENNSLIRIDRLNGDVDVFWSDGSGWHNLYNAYVASLVKKYKKEK